MDYKEEVELLNNKVILQANAIAIMRKALRNCKNANPEPDLSHHKYVDGFRFIERYVDEVLAKIETMIGKDND
jgi:hypothetical protein